ncbi:MAG TPA: hypothetical protein VHB93_01575 [Candidatus Paceibacterota bacterium]|nr:hypothetical protein [Candidatus Paceibacterota bacterium]
MDRLWSHLFSVIEQEVPLRYPLFLYNPHNWSALLRTETDRAHEDALKIRKRPAYLVIGSGSELDKEATRTVGFKHVEVHFDPRLQYESYLGVIGEYVIEVQFSPKTRAAIRRIFQKARTLEDAHLQLVTVDDHAVSKIVIERNKAKAARFARRFARDFYIPKRYRP